MEQEGYLLCNQHGEVLESRHAKTPMILASNQKLLALATVLDTLDPKSTIETKCWYIDQEFVLVGAGDPAISSRYNQNPNALFEDITHALQKMKVNYLQKLSADISLFSGPPKPASWLLEDEPFYYAPDISPLSYEDNCTLFTCQNQNGKITSKYSSYITVIDQQKSVPHGDVIEHYQQNHNTFTVSSVIPVGKVENEYLSVEQPARYTLFCLRKFLQENGIVVDEIQLYHQNRELKNAQLLLSHHSPSIIKLVTTAMQRSNNFITEMLTWLTAAKVYQVGSWKNSVKLLESFLTKNHITGFEVDDSCGLSRKNRASPEAIVHLLMAIRNLPNFKSTLKKMTIGAKTIYYKTGSMSGIYCISGYIDQAPFSIMLSAPYSKSILQNCARKYLFRFCQLLDREKDAK
jgi:D-alanyl-D-alanine carboxypeptidase/D-alanyl-D-alanine-endopeptidase (penicillin-binding protein 4)